MKRRPRRDAGQDGDEGRDGRDARLLARGGDGIPEKDAAEPLLAVERQRGSRTTTSLPTDASSRSPRESSRRTSARPANAFSSRSRSAGLGHLRELAGAGAPASLQDLAVDRDLAQLRERVPFDGESGVRKAQDDVRAFLRDPERRDARRQHLERRLRVQLLSAGDRIQRNTDEGKRFASNRKTDGQVSTEICEQPARAGVASVGIPSSPSKQISRGSLSLFTKQIATGPGFSRDRRARVRRTACR